MECTRNRFRFRLLTVTDELLKVARSYLRSISENKFLRVKGPYGTRVGGQIWAARYPGCQPGILDDDQVSWRSTRNKGHKPGILDADLVSWIPASHDGCKIGIRSTPGRRRVSREIHMTTFISISALQLTVALMAIRIYFSISFLVSYGRPK